MYHKPIQEKFQGHLASSVRRIYQALVKDVDCEGKEALHWAAIKGHDAVAQILLANKAQVEKNRAIFGGKSLLHVVFCQSYFYLRVPKDQPEFNVLRSEIPGVFESPKWRDSIAPGVSSWTCLFGPNPPGTRCRCQ